MSDGGRLPVADLLNKLTEKLAGRDVVVLLDAGRLPPDPLVGHLADGFADRLENDPGVKDALARNDKLLLMCGVSAGETGWESEERQATAFGWAVLEALHGNGDATTGKLSAETLFKAIEKNTREWTAGNRPVPQTPLVLPRNPAAERVQATAAYRSDSPAPLPPLPAAVPTSTADPNKLWQEHDRLAADTPHPSAYAPVAWRRGRELLVRCQQAVRAGEPVAAKRLAEEVESEFKLVAAAVKVGREYVKASGAASVPLAGYAGNGGAADLGKQLDSLARDDWWGLTDFPKLRQTPADRRPAEAHLAVMVHDFYKSKLVPAAKPPDGWQTALVVRRAAERAAFGSPLGERSWDAVKGAVLAADRDRRPAEDRLFATAAKDQDESRARLTELGAAYESAGKLGERVRAGSRLRDELFADLPFIGRWAAASNRDEAATAVLSAWTAAHKLADALAAPGDGLQAAADEADRAGRAARAAVKDAEPLLTAPEGQTAWYDMQPLLACPLVPAAVREIGLKASRAKTAALLDGKSPAADKAADVPRLLALAKKQAVAHAKLAAAALGPTLMEKQQKDTTDTLPSFGGLAKDLGVVAADESKTTELPRLAASVAGHFAEASRNAVPKDYGSAAEVYAKEPASRSAVLLDRKPGDAVAEPAEAAAALRWRELLAGLAKRASEDHWYDEANLPYWKTHADHLLGDANAAYGRSGLPAVAGLSRLDGWTDDEPFALAVDTGTATPFRWTTQRQQQVRFKLTAKLPDAGLAVGWPAATSPDIGWAGPGDRRVLPPGEPLAGTLELNPKAADRDGAVTPPPSATAYFRGRINTKRLEISISRRPEREIVETAPRSGYGGAIAIRAEPDVPIGQVAILLDYSGSMRKHLTTGKLVDDKPHRETTKFSTMLAALEGVLLQLPKGTPLRIRQFSALDRQPTDADTRAGSLPDAAPADIFPEPGGRAEVDWDGPESQRYKNLMERLARYYPYYWTPLVETIDEAARKDFVRTGELDNLAKTLVVLTDGVDERKSETSADIAARLPAAKEDLRATFRQKDGRGVGLFVVPLGLNADDSRLSGELFADISAFPVPGRLLRGVEGADVSQLKKQLVAAIFPKLKLTEGGVVIPKVDRTGLPSRPDRWKKPPYSKEQDREAGGGTDLRWSPWVKPGTYTATPSVNPDPGPKLTLTDEDTIILGFSKDDAGRVRVRRELYADYFELDRSGRRPADAPADIWSVTCPRPFVERGKLEAKVFVERLPPHRRAKPNLEAVTELSAEPPDPAADGSELVWFDLLTEPGFPDTKGLLTVERLYKHGAPVWRLSKSDWPGGRVQVRATVATKTDDGLEPPHRIDVETPDRGDERAWAWDEGKLTARVTVEDSSRPGVPPEDGASWVVVRARHPAGKYVFARLLSGPRPVASATHRYYPAADGMADYTAAFRVPTAELRNMPRVRVNLARVDWALEQAEKKRLAVTLKAASPDGTNQQAPQEITPPADDK